MTDDNQTEETGPAETGEEPQIYNVTKDLTGWKFNRRGFLAAAAAAATTAGAAVGAANETNSVALPKEEARVDPVPLTVALPIMHVVRPGESFTQVWQFTNNSSMTWCRGASLYLESDSLQLSRSIPFPDLAPGQTVAVQVAGLAPAQTGTYQGSWRIQAADAPDPGSSGSFTVLSTPVSPPVESPHPYTNSMNQTWIVTNPDINAQSTRIHFSQVDVETNWDYIYIRDNTGQEIQRITGSFVTGLWSNPVPGREVRIQLVTDGTITAWGFSVDQVETSTVTYVYLPIIRKDPTPTPTPCPCYGVCSCDGYHCTCDSVCTCNAVHYWHPN